MSCNLPHTWRVSSEFDNCSRIRPMFMANGHLSHWRKRNDNSFRSIFNFVARARPPLSYFSSNSSACRMTERLAFENRPTVAFPFRLPLQTPPLNVISVMCWMGKSVWLGDYSALRPSAMRVLGRASRSIIAFSKSAATAIPAFFYSVQHIVYMYIGWHPIWNSSSLDFISLFCFSISSDCSSLLFFSVHIQTCSPMCMFML
jgi:hypothetical protein